MRVKEIEILNLWGKEKIILPFTNRVTFLTGYNGSGKSTLLNIIYDSLGMNSKNKTPATSKSRIWSCKTEFDNGLVLESTILPRNDGDEKIVENLEKKVEAEISFHDITILNEIEELYRNSSGNKTISHIVYGRDAVGEINLKSFSIPTNISEDEQHAIAERIESRNVAFIFQEDRKSLHDREKSSIDLSLNYWAIYKNSIDERFCCIRDLFQIHESQININVIDRMMSSEMKVFSESDEYSAFKEKLEELQGVITKLNSYFIKSGKQIARDEDNKITLKRIEQEEVISWHLLSRGEKTLIYLFFAVYLYKDKVEVFLLDEPEISLHIKWQKDLIRDLSDMAIKSQFIIATHSPSLIKKGWLGNCLELVEVE
jgi:predicted ATPase